ncbi:MAG: type II secretion system F family protein [Burkholderiaceae bacterium]|jgi:general secretion pathway protein F|nr:type II secretion system F family protein [Burkholderiaceae bacterium]
MIDFQYTALAKDGTSCQGTVRAPTQEAARMRLIGQGVTPIRLESSSTGPASLSPRAGGAKLRRNEVLSFTREMAHLKQANMPLDRALTLLRDTAATERLKHFISALEEGIRGGKSLYASLLPFERDFGKQYLVLIRAGETSGSLGVVLKELAARLETDDKLRNYVISSMTYPIILLVVSVLSVTLLLAFVVPQFREIFDSMGDALPYSTRLIIGFSDFLRFHWMAILAALAVALFFFSRWSASDSGRTHLHGILIEMPLLGNVIKNLQFAVYFRTFGSLLQRGVPMVDALRISLDTLTNAALRKDFEPLVGVVKSGKRLSTGFVSRHFDKSGTPQLVRVAEETGQMETTLLGLADRYEDQGRRTMDRVLATMEPLIIILLGALVAFIIVAILGGVLSINETI